MSKQAVRVPKQPHGRSTRLRGIHVIDGEGTGRRAGAGGGSSKEFKADAVALVFDGGRLIAHVAYDLGAGATSLGN